MDQNREEVILVGYQKWLEYVLPPMEKPENRIPLLIALINSSSVEDPIISLKRIKDGCRQAWNKFHFFNEKQFDNIHVNFLSRITATAVYLADKKTVTSKKTSKEKSIIKFISDLSEDDKSYLIKKNMIF